MGATDEAAIVRLQSGDVPAVLALSSDAHWNQIEADWQFFLAHGIVCGIVERDVGLIATASLLPYAEGNAWVSMVLVTASRQRRGLATRLLDVCLKEATRQKRTAWLDATPAGAAVYGALGFTPVGVSQRMRLECAAASPALMPAGNIDDLLARDLRAFGFDRSVLLHELLARSGSRLVTQDGAIALIRDGRTARHIGPLYADDTASAVRLLVTIVKSEAGPLLLDASGDYSDFIDILAASGWTSERPFQRMRFGLTKATGSRPAFAGAGPEYG